MGEAAPVAERPLAMRREPSKMNGWYGPARLFSFQKEVQPVFDRRCVSCHDYGKKAGDKINLSGDKGASYSHARLGMRRGESMVVRMASGGGFIARFTK